MNKNTQEKLQALFVAYTKNLPDKIRAIDTLWTGIKQQWDTKQFQTFHREVHSLTGSAGTYGYSMLSQSARQLEVYLKTLLNNATLTYEQELEIDRLLAEMKTTIVSPPEEKLSISSEGNQPINKLIYIVDEDKKFTQELSDLIGESGYQLIEISTIPALRQALEKEIAGAIIVDIQEISLREAELLVGILKQTHVPLFCTSTNANLLTRLQAIRVGSSAFFQKPGDTFYLAKTLNQICGTVSDRPYRILIIDDSSSLAEYYSLVLQETGMITQSITNPLLLMQTIEEFQPDLILMDIYMPECTGIELAAVLRQETFFTSIPIIFLSSEDDKLKQLSALSVGDDFLTKPVLPKHLVETVKYRAKRATILNAYMTTDSLTGLLNHTNILQRLELELARAEREKTQLAFIMLDIDHFKTINDTYGHPMGDKVLRKLSTLLVSNLRKIDLIGRYGGEEFAIILPNTNPKDSLTICNNLRTQFENIQFIGPLNVTFSVTMSLGVANYPEIKKITPLVNAADKALYVAKHNGRNQVVAFEEDLPA